MTDNSSCQTTKEGYTILWDRTVDLESIPSIKKCNACLTGNCEHCGHSNRCHCAKYHHGIPLPKQQSGDSVE